MFEWVTESVYCEDKTHNIGVKISDSNNLVPNEGEVQSSPVMHKVKDKKYYFFFVKFKVTSWKIAYFEKKKKKIKEFHKTRKGSLHWKRTLPLQDPSH